MKNSKNCGAEAKKQKKSKEFSEKKIDRMWGDKKKKTKKGIWQIYSA